MGNKIDKVYIFTTLPRAAGPCTYLFWRFIGKGSSL